MLREYIDSETEPLTSGVFYRVIETSNYNGLSIYMVVSDEGQPIWYNEREVITQVEFRNDKLDKLLR